MASGLAMKLEIGTDRKEALDGFVALPEISHGTQIRFRILLARVNKLAGQTAASDEPSSGTPQASADGFY